MRFGSLGERGVPRCWLSGSTPFLGGGSVEVGGESLGHVFFCAGDVMCDGMLGRRREGEGEVPGGVLRVDFEGAGDWGGRKGGL